MGSVTSQKSRRRLDSYMEKCSIPRLFISQSKIEPTTHVPVIDGMQCKYDPYASVRCATEDSYIDYTITVYDRADTVTDLQTGTVNTIVPTDYYFIGNQIAIPHGGKVRFDLKSRKEGYLDSATYTSYIYNSRQKLVLNVSPNTTQPNDPYIFQNVGTCTMDTGSITEDVKIRFNTSFGVSSMPEAPLMPMSQTDGTLYAGTFSLPALDLSTYYVFTAKAFSISGSMDDSDPVTVYYIVRASAPQPPEFTPRPGNFTSEQQVSITDPSGACSIIYTTDGTTPSIDNGSYYTNPIQVNHTTTIKAICRVPGSNIVSQVATGTYNIEPITNIRILQPYPITSTSATLIGVVYGSSPVTSQNTGFKYRKVGNNNWTTLWIDYSENYSDGLGNGKKFTANTNPLDPVSVYEVCAFTESGGDYIESETIRFSTPNPSNLYLYSVSPTEMVEMAKVNLSFFRLYSFESGKKAHHNDLKQYGRCGDKIVFHNQWDYIGGKSYNIQMQAQRRTNNTTGIDQDATERETFTVPANNTTSGSLGVLDSSDRADSSGGEVCRDLLGWGTSGNGEKTCSPHAVSYYPFATSSTSSNYYAYDNPQADLMVGGAASKIWADWSQVISYNVAYSDGTPIKPIDNILSYDGTQWDGGTRVSINTMCFPGAKKANGSYYSTRPSKTLSYYEMDYMLGLSGSNYRQTSSGHRFAKGRIVHNNSFINGLIIFSDRYTTDMNGDITITRYDDPTAPYSTNTIDSGKWLANLDNVATFLPAAGERNGTSVQQSGQKGVYWTRTSVEADEEKASALVFTDSDVQLPGVYKFHGGSVRLCGRPDISMPNMYSVSVNFQMSPEYAAILMDYVISGDIRIDGTGSYESGTTCTLELVDNVSVVSDVYWLDADSGTGTVLHSGRTYSFTVTRDIRMYAVLTARFVSIQASVNPSGYGSVQGVGSWPVTIQATLLAEPNDGYEFVNWTEGQDVVYAGERYSFIATQDRTLVANFAPVGFNISVTPNPSNGGSITGSGSYSQGQTCQLSATAGPGYEFSRWAESGSQISTSNPYSFSVSGSRDIVCDFNVSRYDITPVATTGGTVTGAQSNITYGTPVQLTATPSSGYWFKNWTLSSTIVSTDPVYEFLASQTATYTANFSLPVEITALSSGIYSQMSNGDSLYVLMYNTIRARYYANTSPSTTTSGSTIPASITSSQATAMTTNGYIFKITRYNSASFYIQNVNNLYLYSNSGGSLRISNVNKTRWYPTDYDSSNGWFFRRAGSGATYRLRGSSTTTLGCSSTDSFNRWKLYQVSNIIKNS